MRRVVLAASLAVPVFASGALASLAACGLTADFSGLQGGARDGGGPGDVLEVGAGGDAGDGGATEGAAGDDGGGPDGTDTPDAGFCASRPAPVRFCDDFDEGQAIGDGWSATDVWQGQTIAIDHISYSPPSSFLSDIQSGNAPASARLWEDLPLDAAHVHVEFKALLPPLSGGDFEIMTLHETIASGVTYGVFYKYQNGNLLVFVRTQGADGGDIDLTKTIGPPPTTGWLHVEIDVDVSASATLVVKHDGVVVVNAIGVNTSTPARAAMFVELGYYSFLAADAIAHFDDVVIDWP